MFYCHGGEKKADKLPWSLCRRWAEWKACSCLWEPAWFLCTRFPGSWEEERAGRAGHSPSPGLPRSWYLHSNTTAQSEARRVFLLYYDMYLNQDLKKIKMKPLKPFSLQVAVKAESISAPPSVHFLYQGYFIFYSCLFFMLAVLCAYFFLIYYGVQSGFYLHVSCVSFYFEGCFLIAVW